MIELVILIKTKYLYNTLPLQSDI